jgi:uridine kinase
MAIRVLLDHGIPEANIIFLTFLIARRGHLSVHRAFPSIRIVTAAIDPGLEEMHFPLNGLLLGEAAGEGDFGAQFIDERPGNIEREGENEEEVDEKEADQEGECWCYGEEGLGGFAWNGTYWVSPLPLSIEIPL